jgi:hypothetical protein
MRIYAVADIHGRQERLAAVETHLAAHHPDVLVVAGDLSRRRHPRAVLASLSRFGLPVLLVRGNSDSRQLETRLGSYPALKSLHLICRTVNGVDFVGVSGTLPLPFHSRLGFREASTAARLADLLAPGSVLVAHPPPYGVRDQVLGCLHAGSRAVKRLVTQCAPALVICGHIHEGSGVARTGRTVVVNCAMNRWCSGVLIDYDGRSAPEWSLLQ